VLALALYRNQDPDTISYIESVIVSMLAAKCGLHTVDCQGEMQWNLMNTESLIPRDPSSPEHPLECLQDWLILGMYSFPSRDSMTLI
jgi:hypothetical protein